jgi:glycosyltransferase involved in cell wall biosynthesis
MNGDASGRLSTVGKRLPASAVVATFNEARLLDRCLASLPPCEELLVVDLGSTDESVAIAEAHGARVIHHEWVPDVNAIIHEMIEKIGTDWMLQFDPDEVIAPALAHELLERFDELVEGAAMVVVPTQNYFRGRPLRGTIWGGVRIRRLLIHRHRTWVDPGVHGPVAIHDGFRMAEVEYRGDNSVSHYWLASYKQWFEKHRRYLRLEGASRLARGEHFNRGELLRALWRPFYHSFVTKQGYRDGAVGLALSAFWGWYNVQALLALRKAEAARS